MIDGDYGSVKQSERFGQMTGQAAHTTCEENIELCQILVAENGIGVNILHEVTFATLQKIPDKIVISRLTFNNGES